jgi:hypothetical protein
MSAVISPNPPHATPLRLGVPQTHGGITIVPLLVTALPQRAYITLDEAMPLGFTIEEVDVHGHVPQLLVRNPLTTDVLLYDGEEVVGAKQNRVLEASILVAASTTQKIPVACVEAGRWHDSGQAFAAADRVAHPESRRRKAGDLEHAPLSAGIAQQTVWAEIDERLHTSSIESRTSALSDVHDAERSRIDGLAEAFALVDGQCGAILALGDRLCLDLVSRPEAWTRLWPKLRRGYLLDGIGHRHDEPTANELIARFADAVASAPASSRPSPGLGEDVRLHGTTVSGASLVVDGEVIQQSAYSRDDRIMGREAARIVPPSRRHS